MSDIRINALATTATSAASDDYLALDGSANGTRKILATNVAQNVTDVTFGASGPSAKSSINARAARQGLVFDGTAGATATLGSAIGESAGTINIVFTVPSAIPSAAMEVFDLYGTGGGDLNDLYITILGTSGDLRLNARYSGTNHLVTLYSGFVTAYAGKTVELAVVLDGTNQTTYLNGVQISQTAIDHNLTGAVNAFLGKSPAGTDIFKGTISSPLIYNRALSAAEVVSLFEAGVPAAADYNTASNTSINTGAFSNAVSSLFDYDTFSGASATGFSASCTAGTNPNGCYVFSNPVNFDIKAGQQFLVKFTLTVTSGSAPRLSFGSTEVGNLASNVEVSSAGSNSFILTATKTGSYPLYTYNLTSESANFTISSFSITRLGLLLAPDAGQAGNGYVWNDQSGNVAQIVLPSSGVAWNLPSITGNRIRGTTSTNGNQQLLGASVLLPAECQITHVRARARSGTPTITIGTASGGAQIVASVALSTTWLNCTIALTGGIVSSVDDIWVGSNSTDVVETDIAFQPLDF